MATTIKLKNSVTTTNTPTSLVQGEVAINVTDKKVWVGNAATTPIQIVGAGTTGNAAGSNNQVQYNSSGSFAGDADFTFNGTTVTMANDSSISGLTVGKGGGASDTNTVVGAASALAANTSGTNNNAFGRGALQQNTTGSFNSAFGWTALLNSTTGSYNTAIGNAALTSNTTASSNTAVGYQASYSSSTGTENSAFGRSALYTNTASNNAAFGEFTMYTNSTGTNNAAFGNATMYYNTTGSANTALGRQALLNNTTASNNTAVGYQAGYTLTSGATNNTFVGYRAGYSTITSGSNQFFGYSAGSEVTTGYYNTIIGGYNGNSGGLDIRTANNYIVLSDGQGNPRAYWDSNGVQFTTASITDAYAIQVKNSQATRPYGANFRFTGATPNNTTQAFLDCEDTTNIKAQIYSSGAYGSRPNSYGGLSDIKLKQDIVDASSQWNDIKAIKVRKFRFKDDPNAPLQIGVVAQEIEQTSAGLVYETPDFTRNETGEKVETGEVTKSVKYSILYMKAIKALQEAMERIETLEAKVNALENK